MLVAAMLEQRHLAEEIAFVQLGAAPPDPIVPSPSRCR